jgi:hypothetical protein
MPVITGSSAFANDDTDYNCAGGQLSRKLRSLRETCLPVPEERSTLAVLHLGGAAMASSTDGPAKKALDDLATSHTTNAAAWEAYVNRELAAALRQRGLKTVRLDRAIFSRVGKAVIAHAAIGLDAKTTKRDLRKEPHAVGVLVNAVALTDPVSTLELAPGAYLVELRPITGDGFAFDFVGGDGKVKLATRASLKEGSRFNDLAPDQALAARPWFLLDVVIDDPWGGMNDPLPPDTQTRFCVSFLEWIKCWIFSRI